jgi:hypothetical protein
VRNEIAAHRNEFCIGLSETHLLQAGSSFLTRSAAKAMDVWPRIQMLLRSLAADWDDAGKREDIRAAQMEMRE